MSSLSFHASRLLVGAVFLCSLLGLSAQSGHIAGVVTDEAGTPLAFATVGSEGSRAGTITDSHGRFGLDARPGIQTLMVSYVGHRGMSTTVQLSAGDTIHVSMALPEQVVDLAAFTVQGSMTRGSGPSRTLPGSAWYVGPREIQAQAATDVHRLLRSVPGVNIQEEDGFGLRPNIGLRGAGSERSSKITLMEDGVLIAPAPYAQPAAYYFPTIGRMHAVEVVKGSSQVRYGPLTTGGAVNLISTPVPDRTAGLVALWGGGFGTRNLHATAGTRLNRHQVGVETFQQAADGFKRLDNGGPTGFAKQDYLGKWQWSSSDSAAVRHAVGVKAGHTREVSHETYLGLTLDDFASDPFRRYAGSAEDRMEVEHDLATIRYAVEWGQGNQVAATVYRTNTFRNWYKLDQVVDSASGTVGIGDLLQDPAAHADAMRVVRGGTSADDALLVKANNRNYQSSGAQLSFTRSFERERATHAIEVGARLHSDYMDRYQWRDGWRMQDGELFRTSRGTPGTESNRIARAEALALHAAYDLDLGRLALHPGLRYEHITMAQDDYGKQDPGRSGGALVSTSNTVDVWIPGFGADLSVNEFLVIFAGVHKGFSPPGTVPGTLPEESINYEGGVRLERSGLDVQVIGFLNDYERMLGSDLAAAGGAGTGDLFNAGEALVKGFECFVSGDLLRGRNGRMRIPLSIAYTLTDARFISDFESDFEPWGTVLSGDRVPYTPVHQLNTRAGLETERFSCALNAQYQSEVTTVTGPAGDVPETAIPARTVVDANATYRFRTGMEVFATAANMLDAVYEAGRLPAGTRPGLPRMLQGGVRMRF